jgi:hypothetical protein
MASQRSTRNIAVIGLIALLLAALGWGVWVWNNWGERRQDISDSVGAVMPPGGAAPGQVAQPDPTPEGARPADPAETGAPDATGDAYRPASERRAVNTREEQP